MDVWDLHKYGWWVVIPTNMQTNCLGEAVMGAGLAKQASDRFPGLAARYGRNLRQQVPLLNGCAYLADKESRCLLVPTKVHWRDRSTVDRVEEACCWLIKVPEELVDLAVVPALGCGLGGLRWADVLPCLDALVRLDRRYHVICPDSGEFHRPLAKFV